MAGTVGRNYRVEIEPAIRERLGVQPGWKAVQTVVDDHLEIRFVPPEQGNGRKHGQSPAGSLRKYARGAETDWSAIKEAAWVAEVEATADPLVG